MQSLAKKNIFVKSNNCTVWWLMLSSGQDLESSRRQTLGHVWGFLCGFNWGRKTHSKCRWYHFHGTGRITRRVSTQHQRSSRCFLTMDPVWLAASNFCTMTSPPGGMDPRTLSQNKPFLNWCYTPTLHRYFVTLMRKCLIQLSKLNRWWFYSYNCNTQERSEYRQTRHCRIGE